MGLGQGLSHGPLPAAAIPQDRGERATGDRFLELNQKKFSGNLLPPLPGFCEVEEVMVIS